MTPDERMEQVIRLMMPSHHADQLLAHLRDTIPCPLCDGNGRIRKDGAT